MATWMTHFRIANKFIDELSQYDLDIPKFVFANIAPDCGVLNDDGLTYTPSGDISHFKKDDEYEFDKFVSSYLKNEKDLSKFSFYLGYYLHLLCDEAWRDDLFRPKRQEFIYMFDDEAEGSWAFKDDWYDLDKLFIKKKSDFRGFDIFKNIESFPNIYFEFFPTEAYNMQLNRIREFYLEEVEGLEREYIYLKEVELDSFVDKTYDKVKYKIFDVLREYEKNG